MTPRLSVIIPTYNRAKLVCRAVASVLDQSQGKPVEVIVVDDGSTDSTVVELQKNFAAAIAQKQLIILKETHLGDCGAARNRAIPHAQGEILAFLDSDDQWLPGRVDRLIKTFESADLVLCPEQMPSSQDQKDWLKVYLAMNRGVASSITIRRNLFEQAGRFPEKYFGPQKRFFRGCEDYELILRSMLILDQRGQANRFCAMDIRQDIVIEHQPEGIGRLKIREQMWRELTTLARVSYLLPRRIWPTWTRRVLGATKAIVLGGAL